MFQQYTPASFTANYECRLPVSLSEMRNGHESYNVQEWIDKQCVIKDRFFELRRALSFKHVAQFCTAIPSICSEPNDLNGSDIVDLFLNRCIVIYQAPISLSTILATKS